MTFIVYDKAPSPSNMKDFSPGNLKYMRPFAEAWQDAEFVQEVLPRVPWHRQLAI